MGAWDLRTGSSSLSTSVTYTDWGTFVNNWFHYRHHDTERFEPQGTSGTITITDGADDTNFATFDWNDVVQLTNGTALSIRALDFESQLPAPTSGTLHITITDGGNPIPAKQIQIHTNQTVDLNQSFRLTPNTATNTVSQISEFAEGGSNSRTNSSYSARDPSGSQVISVTAQSRETLTEVALRLRAAINAVTDLPTNFTAEVLDNNLLLKPTSGLVDQD